MKKIFGAYLKHKITNDSEIFYWYRFTALIVMLFALVIFLLVLGIAEFLDYSSIGEIKIVKFTPVFRLFYWMGTILLLFVLLFNRKSTIEFKGNKVRFRKRSLLPIFHSFNLGQVSQVSFNKQWDIGETDAGMSREIYNLTVILQSGKKIRIGSFNEEDCKRLKKAFGFQ